MGKKNSVALLTMELDMTPSDLESTQLYHNMPQQPCFFGDLHTAFTTPEQYHYLPPPKPQPNQTLRTLEAQNDGVPGW